MYLRIIKFIFREFRNFFIDKNLDDHYEHSQINNITIGSGGYLIFDTETTGLPINRNDHFSKLSNWPRITQLAWQLFDNDKKLLSQGNYFIKPDGWEIEVSSFTIANNMSTKKCEDLGLPIIDVLDLFLKDYSKSNFLIAHNLKFDLNVLRAEVLRYNLKFPKEIINICTMLEANRHSKLLRINKNKYPSQSELHTLLFGEGYEGSHDALNDVAACSKCFFELVRLVHKELE